jgi:sugar/nucleoside kinase (ribokinase family)
MSATAPGRALICGSMAYDTIMVFADRFANHILPDKIHMLNVSFLVPQMRREFGGCAGNIAYNLKLLGETGYPMGGIGQDFQPYSDWMKKVGISEKYLVNIPEEYCPQAFITTDLDDNQITAFHPGAMSTATRTARARRARSPLASSPRTDATDGAARRPVLRQPRSPLSSTRPGLPGSRARTWSALSPRPGG